MSEHMLEWLPAYHDGQLSQNRRQRVEAHLQGCPSCRAELEALQGLSALLKSAPAPAHTPPGRFAAQVQLLLPRETSARRRLAPLPRWMLGAPLILIVGWAFLQAALMVTAFVLATGFLFPAIPALTGWLANYSSLEITGTLSLLNLGLLVGAASLWAGWMALWWSWQQNHQFEPTFIHLEKEV